MKQKISFIYFDLGGVVINNIDARKNLAKKQGTTYEQVDGFFAQHWESACRGDLSHSDYMKLCKAFGMAHPNDDILEFFTQTQLVYQETVEFIHEIKHYYPLGILSNAELGLIEAHMEKGNIPRDPWSVVIESATHKTIKPEPKIFEIAEGKAGVNPSEIFFIDDVPEYIAAAKSRGWQGMVFNSHDTKKSIQQLRSIFLKK